MPLISPDLKADEMTSDSLELYVKKYDFEGGLSKFLHDQIPNKDEIIARGPLVYFNCKHRD